MRSLSRENRIFKQGSQTSEMISSKRATIITFPGAKTKFTRQETSTNNNSSENILLARSPIAAELLLKADIDDK
jgi:hypothetical protein